MAKKSNPDEGSDPKEKGNVYDKIFKENATSIFLPLIEITLGIKIILAILSYYPPERTEAVLRLLLKRLHETCLETGGLEKYISQLIVLSRLRRIEDITIKICDDMSLHIDIEKDTLYKKGMEKGIEKMKDELEAQKKLFVINLINNFQLDDTSIAATAGVTSGFVRKIRKELGL